MAPVQSSAPQVANPISGKNYTLDDASPIIYYIDFPAVQVSPTCASTGTCAYSNTLHQSTLQSASAAFQFTGDAFYLYGILSPAAGPFTVTVDGVTYGSLTGYCETTIPQSLLFHKTGLDPATTHQVVLRNTGPLVVSLDYVIVTSGGTGGSPMPPTGGPGTPVGAPVPAAGAPAAYSSSADVFGMPTTVAPVEKEDNNDQIGAIIGAVAGVLIFLVIAAMILRSHKKSKATDTTPVVLGTAANPQTGGFFSATPQTPGVFRPAS